MNTDEFLFLNKGRIVKPFTQADVPSLAPIDIRKEGRQRAILLIHGFTSSPYVYHELIPHLTQYDAIVCPLLPGHGESMAAFAEVDAQEWLHAVETHCESLLKEYKEVDVLGLSLGGILATHLGMRYPLHHLYLLAPALALTINIPVNLSFIRLLRAIGIRQLRNIGGGICREDSAELTFRKIPLQSAWTMLNLIRAFQLGPLRCPTDLFLAEHDQTVDSHRVKNMFKDKLNVTTHWLKNSAHVIPLDYELNEVVKVITTEDHGHVS